MASLYYKGCVGYWRHVLLGDRGDLHPHPGCHPAPRKDWPRLARRRHERERVLPHHQRRLRAKTAAKKNMMCVNVHMTSTKTPAFFPILWIFHAPTFTHCLQLLRQIYTICTQLHTFDTFGHFWTLLDPLSHFLHTLWSTFGHLLKSTFGALLDTSNFRFWIWPV